MRTKVEETVDSLLAILKENKISEEESAKSDFENVYNDLKNRIGVINSGLSKLDYILSDSDMGYDRHFWDLFHSFNCIFGDKEQTVRYQLEKAKYELITDKQYFELVNKLNSLRDYVSDLFDAIEEVRGDRKLPFDYEALGLMDLLNRCITNPDGYDPRWFRTTPVDTLTKNHPTLKHALGLVESSEVYYPDLLNVGYPVTTAMALDYLLRTQKAMKKKEL